MKIKEGFVLHDVCGEKVIIAKANKIFDSSHRIVSFYGVSKNKNGKEISV